MKRVLSLVLAMSLLLSLFVLSVSAEGGELQSLAEIYKDDFLIGSIFSPNEIPGTRFDFIKTQFNALTAENAMKPDAMQRSKGNFNFTSVDNAVEQILGAGINVIGHTLAWHNQSPEFLNKGVSRSEAEQNLTDHVNNVAGHYAGKILAWDVLNEAMRDGPQNPSDWRGALRITDWYSAFSQDGGSGADYIYMLFKLAREADPNAILYYNDYNLNDKNKATAVYHMVKELNEQYLAEGNDRLLIEGIGMQGHYSMDTPVKEVEESLELFSDLGVEISVTELDVGVGNAAATGLSEDEELRQAVVYAQLFSIYKEYSDIIARVTFWGINDGASWRKDRFPLIFNDDFSPKLAYYAVVDPEGFLEEHPVANSEMIERSVGVALYGTPEIDGTADSIWNEAEVLPVNQMLQAWETAKGTVKLLWDEENIYVLVEVTDTVLDDAGFNFHDQDSVEIFIGEKNTKADSYKTGDGQFRVSFTGRNTFGSNTKSKGFESAVNESGTSYTVEMKIPFSSVTPYTDMVIGFEAQINDAKDGVRQGIAKWNNTTNNAFSATSTWGEVKLTGGNIAPPDGVQVEGEAGEAGEAEDNAGNNAGNSNGDGNESAVADANSGGNPAVVVFIIVLAVVVVFGFVFAINSKNKKNR